MTVKAKYKCLKCNYKFESNPGPTSCPNCGHLYIEWLNYRGYWKDLDLENIREFSIEGELDENRNIKRVDI